MQAKGNILIIEQQSKFTWVTTEHNIVTTQQNSWLVLSHVFIASIQFEFRYIFSELQTNKQKHKQLEFCLDFPKWK